MILHRPDHLFTIINCPKLCLDRLKPYISNFKHIERNCAKRRCGLHFLECHKNHSILLPWKVPMLTWLAHFLTTWLEHTPWKMNMEHTNHPWKERKLIFQSPMIMCKMLIFRGVSNNIDAQLWWCPQVGFFDLCKGSVGAFGFRWIFFLQRTWPWDGWGFLFPRKNRWFFHGRPSFFWLGKSHGCISFSGNEMNNESERVLETTNRESL